MLCAECFQSERLTSDVRVDVNQTNNTKKGEAMTTTRTFERTQVQSLGHATRMHHNTLSGYFLCCKRGE